MFTETIHITSKVFNKFAFYLTELLILITKKVGTFHMDVQSAVFN